MESYTPTTVAHYEFQQNSFTDLKVRMYLTNSGFGFFFHTAIVVCNFINERNLDEITFLTVLHFLQLEFRRNLGVVS